MSACFRNENSWRKYHNNWFDIGWRSNWHKQCYRCGIIVKFDLKHPAKAWRSSSTVGKCLFLMKAGVHYSWKIFCPRACRVGCVGGECNTHTHTHTHTLFWNLAVFWQNMSVKFPHPMLSVNLEYLQQCRILSISSPTKIKFLPVMTAFTEVISTNDYDNNKYLAGKYIRFFTNDIIWCL